MTQIVSMRFTPANVALMALVALAGEARGQDADLARALTAYEPALQPVAGSVVRGDFDGDGETDLAVVATDGARRSLLVAQSDPAGWRIHPLYARLPDGPVELRLVAPGAHRVRTAQGLVELARPGVELVFPGRSSALYAFQKGRWQVHATENY